MRLSSRNRRRAVAALAVIAALMPGEATSGPRLLGEIDFPNSGAASAQADFIEGVLYLHNFEYDEAGAAFQRARAIDPDFAMAYWGGAMAYNHPLWREQARKVTRDLLRSLARTPDERLAKAPTRREKDYLHAVEILYGTVPESSRLPKDERDALYSEAMRALHERYPDDHEAATFYGLSILGASAGDRRVAPYMKAAAVLTEVWDANRNHPGAAHYLIHSYDDPDHAPLGLPMARAYSKIAPAAAHAQHMTSHIFVALGMWDEMAEANEIAIEVERAGGKEPVSGHYPFWGLYGHLQQGRYEVARDSMERATELMGNNPTAREREYFVSMRARYILDTGDWAAATRYVFPETYAVKHPVYHFTSAFAALMLRDEAIALKSLNSMRPLDKSSRTGNPAITEIMKLEIDGFVTAAMGDVDGGLKKLEKAVALESGLSFSFGPPAIPLPSREMLGFSFLQLGFFGESAAAYADQLNHTPRRAQALLGLARASERANREEAAARAYEELAGVWHMADPEVIELAGGAEPPQERRD